MLLAGKRDKLILITVLAISLILLALWSLASGQIDITIADTTKLLFYKLLGLPLGAQEESVQASVLYYIRAPRTLIGILVGMALGCSGAVMQGVFGNPLAEPGIIGVSSGAAMGAVIAIGTGLSAVSMWAMPAFAFCGALFAVFLTVFLAQKNGRMQTMTLLLAGVAVGMLFGAITSGFLTVMNEQKIQQYLFWIIGGLDYRRWEHVYLAFPSIMVGLIMLFFLARHLNILVLGDVEAKSVGMPVLFYRMLLLTLSAIITSIAVCVSGNIAFVGLVVPHIMRILIGPDHRYLLPASALAGACFLILCDILGRIIMPPNEIRVGIMTALLGSPYFLYLLRRLNKTS